MVTAPNGGVAVLTIDRPARRNAVDHETLERLVGEIDAATERSVRVLVLHGAGGHFCAGADLTTVEDRGFVPLLRRVLEGLHDAPFPTMAAIEGNALGAGVQLAAACDLRVATPDARFGVPAGKLGLCVDHWTVRRVGAAVGDSTARALLLGGLDITGEQAHAAGFVQRLGTLDDAMAWATDIAELAPLTLQAHKLMLNRDQGALDDDDVLAARGRAWTSADLQEGLAAFRERRAARFEGR